MPLFWLSFCDADKPVGRQFLGVCIVRAANELRAVPEAWKNGCNPGGEVAMSLIPPEYAQFIRPDELNTLYNRVELREREKVWLQRRKNETNSL